ncbi:hypothetical protein BGW39_011442 [Mortierella sp. 14UC]|nr:hypothetical protein BGW39_011442 [Mortierella sp. 14UC]
MGMGMSMPPTPTDPPPPYSHNNASAGASGSDDGLSSGQCMQSGEEEDQQQQQQQTVTARSRPENQQLNFTRQRLLVHAWGAGACLLGLGSWMVVSEFEPLLLPILEAKVAELELELEMGLEGVVVPFSVCCWVVVTFVWILYALATRYLVSWSGTLVDSSGSGTGTSTGTSEQLAKEEVVVVIKKEEHEQELNLELELEHKEQEFKEHGEQQEFYGNVDVETGEDLSEIGHDMNRAQQRQQERQQSVLAKMPCLQVKNEIRIWSFSLWVLAPTIPRPFGHQHLHNYHQHRPQDVKSARDDSGREMRYPQQHGRGDKQEGGLLLATAGCQDMGETECELVRTEETSEMDRALAVKGVATKAESDNQDLTQDDERVGGDWDVFPLVEKQPSFAQTTHRQQPPRPPPQRAGYMSQSMPDLHAAKRNGVVESALARWSRMTLDPERLGSIFQYYLRQHASTLKRKRQTDGGDRDSSAATDGELHDGSSEDEDDVDDVDDYEEDEEDSGVTFVIRSSTLPTVRVGLYGADQKRLWTSSGSVHLSPMHGDEEEREEPTMSAGPE